MKRKKAAKEAKPAASSSNEENLHLVISIDALAELKKRMEEGK